MAFYLFKFMIQIWFVASATNSGRRLEDTAKAVKHVKEKIKNKTNLFWRLKIINK